MTNIFKENQYKILHNASITIIQLIIQPDYQHISHVL